MVEPEVAVRRLVGVCPGFEANWLAHLAYWEGKPAGFYNDLGVLAHWVVDRMAANEVECFPELFGEVEALLGGASQDTRELIVVGFLEDIQNIATNRQLDPDLVLRFLGPETRKGWFELIAYWHGPSAEGWPGQPRETPS